MSRSPVSQGSTQPFGHSTWQTVSAWAGNVSLFFVAHVIMPNSDVSGSLVTPVHHCSKEVKPTEVRRNLDLGGCSVALLNREIKCASSMPNWERCNKCSLCYSWQFIWLSSLCSVSCWLKPVCVLVLHQLCLTCARPLLLLLPHSSCFVDLSCTGHGKSLETAG